MTEADWLACNEPDEILVHLRDSEAHRKWRLFCCECVKRIGYHLEPFVRSRQAIDIAEGFAEGQVSIHQLQESVMEVQLERRNIIETKIDNALYATALCLSEKLSILGIVRTISWGSTYASRDTIETERLAHSDLLREIFGNPFRPVSMDPAWLTDTVHALATGIYDDRTFDRLPILADALQEAGCDCDDMLNHLRGPGPHVRGCWALDLVLGKE